MVERGLGRQLRKIKMIRNTIIKFIDFFYIPPVRKYVPLQTFRYAVTGGANMMLDALLYFAIFNFVLCKTDVHVGQWVVSSHIAAYIITFPIVFLNGLWLARNITFQNSPLKANTQRARYLLVTLANIIIKYAGIKVLVHLGLFPSVTNALMTIVTVVFSYIMQNKFTFKGNKYE